MISYGKLYDSYEGFEISKKISKIWELVNHSI